MMDQQSVFKDNLPEVTVSELSNQIKQTVETAFDYVRVRGEISRPTIATSGHLYLTLKDDKAVLDGICFKGAVQNLSIQPEEGMEVICTGKITTYAGRSKYQIRIDRMELAGEGALLKLLEDRKKRLSEEGLFDQNKKQLLPFLPLVIGVITSPTGAVLKDILHRIQDRFPLHILVWPVLVQGEKAKDEVAAAIKGFDFLSGEKIPRPDLLIVARGGGSIEDLRAFNEEKVVRAVANCKIPIISAIGHETDVTLIDFVADLRAPTPTAAAELAVPLRMDLLSKVKDNDRRLFHSAGKFLETKETKLNLLNRSLDDPTSVIESRSQHVDYLDQRLSSGVGKIIDVRLLVIAKMAERLPHPEVRFEKMEGSLTNQTIRIETLIIHNMERMQNKLNGPQIRLQIKPIERHIDELEKSVIRIELSLEKVVIRNFSDMRLKIDSLGRFLQSSSFYRNLERGFVVVRDSMGNPIVKVAETKPGQMVTLQFQDGKMEAKLHQSDKLVSSRSGSKQESLF